MAFKKTFVISDESVNSYGFRVNTYGIDLSQAKQNCPAFYDHKTWETPIGHWVNLRIDDKGRLVGDIVIEGANEREKEYIRKIENGDIKGASIGADPLAWNDDPLQLVLGQKLPTLDKCDLFEVSITPLPGNKGSLALKGKDGFVTLSETNTELIPSLKILQPDMKQIALKLGLGETATEQQILDAIVAVQLKAHNAEAIGRVFEEHVTAQAAELPKDQKEFVIGLSKTNVAAAMDFLKLNKTAEATTEGDEPAAQQLASKVQKKEATIVSLIKPGGNNQGKDAEDGKDSFDYLQKKNPVELKRIRNEEPEKYQELAADYGKGVRYTGK